MKLIALALLVAPLAGCAVLDNPSNVANQTVLDEQVGIGTEAAYTAASTLGLALAKAKVIDAAKFKALDNQAFSALVAVRTAYQAGNSTEYLSAAERVYSAVAQIKALVK